ncbi:hypothetical protein AK812_SmicGene40458 [Symbiodinium microadriaticum]|uniref:Cyclic nucleotide-binding domain-containing protein n=1 Tax=Symbiodinium microadriaticum TaxID=2951 RepID=A0A1Q9C8Q6_SYMMI|nr:hypothetical protein AK812_SmicGene40458 [Symbiodinium microadriaticum]
MASFLLLPLLPEHLLEAKWSILSFAAVSGVQGSSRLLFLIWNFNEELQHGFQVAIWRLGLLEGLRRSVAWLALMTSYAGSLWIYKQDWADTSGKDLGTPAATSDSQFHDGGSQPGIIESAAACSKKGTRYEGNWVDSVESALAGDEGSIKRVGPSSFQSLLDPKPPTLRAQKNGNAPKSATALQPQALKRLAAVAALAFIEFLEAWSRDALTWRFMGSYKKIALIQAYKEEEEENQDEQEQESVQSVSTAAVTSDGGQTFKSWERTIYRLARLAVMQDAAEGEVLFRQGDEPVDCYVVLRGTIYRLARLAVMQDAAEGEVLFRQGDEPVDCYVVLRGKVGVYISSAPQESPRDFTLDYVRVVEAPRAGPLGAVEDSGHQDARGFNTYTPDSNLGTKVADLGRGAAFGESSDLSRGGVGQARPYGAEAAAWRSAFQKWFSESISADAYRKRLYFISRIAGFQMETLRNPIKKPERTLGGKSRNVKQTVHPVDRFREEDYKPGNNTEETGLAAKRHGKDGGFVIPCSFSQELTYRDARPQRDVPFGKSGPRGQGAAGGDVGDVSVRPGRTVTQSPPSPGQACSLYVAKSKDLSQLPPRAQLSGLGFLWFLGFSLFWVPFLWVLVLRPFLCYSGAYQCMDQLVESDPKPGMEQELWPEALRKASSRLVMCAASLCVVAEKAYHRVALYSSEVLVLVLRKSGSGLAVKVLFVVYFTALVLLFKAPYCYASYVLPITSARAWLAKRSFLLLLLSEVFISLGSYSAQDIAQWWELNGRAPEEIQMFAFAMVVGLPLLLTILFSALRRLNVWGPWALRDFACLLPPGMLLRVLAVCDVRGHDRSELFVAALLAAAAVDAARYTAVLCAMMTVLGNKWYAMKGCFLAALLASISRAAAPRFQWWVASMGSEPKSFALQPDLSELGEMSLWAVLPPAFAGYVCQVLAVLFFNEDVLTFKGHGCYLADGSEGDLCTSMRKFWVAKVRHRMARASSALSRQKDALKEMPNQDEAAEASGVLPSLLLSPRHGAGGSKHLCLSPKSDEEYSHQVHPSCGDDEDYDVPNEREGISELKSPRAEAEDAWKLGMPEKDTATTKSAVSFDVQTDFVTPSNKDSQGEEDKDAATTVSFALGTSFGQDEGTDAASEKELEFACDQGTPEKDPATTKSAVSFDVQTPRSNVEDSQEAEKDMATTANIPSQNHSGDEENFDDEEAEATRQKGLSTGTASMRAMATETVNKSPYSSPGSRHCKPPNDKSEPAEPFSSSAASVETLSSPFLAEALAFEPVEAIPTTRGRSSMVLGVKLRATVNPEAQNSD